MEQFCGLIDGPRQGDLLTPVHTIFLVDANGIDPEKEGIVMIPGERVMPVLRDVSHGLC